MKSKILTIFLILTYYFVSSEVPLTNFYTGYITVNQTANSQLFYQLFPAANLTLDDNYPLALWIQGGPGCSSQFGNMVEIGPYSIENIGGVLTPVLNNITWNTYFHLLFVDNPSNTGFSLPGNQNVTDSIVAAQQLLVFLEEFYQIFPQFLNQDFYIFGESYAGHYIPALAYQILTTENNIPLKAIAIGNGLVDPLNQFGFWNSYGYAAGIFSEKNRDYVKALEMKVVEEILNGEYLNACDIINNLETYIATFNITGGIFINDYREYLSNVPVAKEIDLVQAWLNQSSTKKLLNVSTNINYQICNQEVFQWFSVDIMQSFANELAFVLQNIPVLIYSGADDMEVNTAGALNFISKLNWPGVQQFMKAKRQIWNIQEGIAGNVKIGGNLTFATIYAAGHIVPFYQPLAAVDMITRFVNGMTNWTKPGAF